MYKSVRNSWSKAYVWAIHLYKIGTNINIKRRIPNSNIKGPVSIISILVFKYHASHQSVYIQEKKQRFA